MPEPKIYFAEERAIETAPEVESLDGTLKAAQSYVDKITKSSWWKNHCQPSWLGVTDLNATKETTDKAIPTKILLRKGFPIEKGVLAWVDHLATHEFRGKKYPVIILSTERNIVGVPAISDQWTILHELAHIWTFDTVGNHHLEFNRALIALIRKYLGDDQARALKDAMRTYGIRGRRA